MNSLKQPLILILTMLLGLSALHASDAVRLASRAMAVPRDWQITYAPPELLLRLRVEADSSLTLLQILDGKDELEPLAVEYLRFHRLLPFPGDHEPGSEFDAIIPLLQSPTQRETFPPEPQAPPSILLADVVRWIERDKRYNNLYQAASGSREPGLADAYRTGSYQLSLFQDYQPLNLQGFPQYSSFLASSFYRGLLSDFHDSVQGPFGEVLTTLRYPYPVTLTTLQAGLGEFEHLFAKGSLQRNNVLGRKDMYLNFDFLVQTGTWLETDASATVFKGDLLLPLGSTDLSIEVADYRNRLSMTQLRQEYWINQNFAIKHRLRHIVAAWRNPWLNLALFGSSETAQANSFDEDLENSSLRVAAYRELNLGPLGIQARYEHEFLTRHPALGVPAPRDNLMLGMDFQGSYITAAAQTRWEDFGQILLDASLGVPLNPLHLEARASFLWNPAPAVTGVTNIYDQTTLLPRVDQRRDRDLALRLAYRDGKRIDLALDLGQRLLTNSLQIAVTDSPGPGWQGKAELNRDVWYAGFKGDFDLPWQAWSVAWTPAALAQSGSADLYLEPALSLSSRFTLSRDLGHGNALFTGFALQGHSSYRNSDPSAFLISPSLLADVWLGVRVSERFELRVSYQNVTDSTLHGVYPVPRSLRADIHCYFLN